MKWHCFSGSWRETNPALQRLVAERVAAIMRAGDGIVSGGAAGVDYWTLHEALRHDAAAERIKILIPGTPEQYFAHLLSTRTHGLYTLAEAAQTIVTQLRDLRRRNHYALIGDARERVIDHDAYWRRDSAEVAAADYLVAFPARTEFGPGLGTWDTVAKARRKGIPIEIHPFDYSRYEP
jgi:hypothetical protein